MVLCHLPEGPTAHFKVSSVRLRKEMKARWMSFWIRSNMKTLSKRTSEVLGYFLSAETRKRSDWTLSRGDSQQLHNSSGSQHRPNVRRSLPTKPAVFGSTSCHLPQPERLCLLQIPQVSWKPLTRQTGDVWTVSVQVSWFRTAENQTVFFGGGSVLGTSSKMRKKLGFRSWDRVSHSSCARFRRAPSTPSLESTSGCWRWVAPVCQNTSSLFTGEVTGTYIFALFFLSRGLFNANRMLSFCFQRHEMDACRRKFQLWFKINFCGLTQDVVSLRKWTLQWASA